MDHAVEYVNGISHTNSCPKLSGPCSKRSISQATYVSGRTVFTCFAISMSRRFDSNERTLTDSERFSVAVSKIVGKRLRWDALTGKERRERHPPIDRGRIRTMDSAKPDQIKLSITSLATALGAVIMDLGRLRAQYSEVLEALKANCSESLR